MRTIKDEGWMLMVTLWVAAVTVSPVFLIISALYVGVLLLV